MCINPCPDSYWEDSSDNTCKICAVGCELCDGAADTCSKCVNGYFLYNGTTC